MKNKKKVLTGITSSGKPHLGNILGAIMPAINMAKDDGIYKCFYFISDLHSLTTIKDAVKRNDYRLSIAAAWLAFGLDTNKHYFYRQSKIPEITELSWYLACFTPYSMLLNSHAFKSKSKDLSVTNSGLLTYPILMAADILLFDADIIPVGKDQKQHIEVTRDIAKKINLKYQNLFNLPEEFIKEKIKTIPGIDGRKMSKSYNNYIDIFVSDKELENQIKKITTSSTPKHAPKEPEKCNVFKIYSLIAEDDSIINLRDKYISGGFGYGDAKKMLFEAIKDKFKEERSLYNHYIKNPKLIEEKLENSENKVRKIAQTKIEIVRQHLGFNKL